MGYICNVTFSEDGVRITKTPTRGVKPKDRFARFKSGTKPRINSKSEEYKALKVLC
jgi:hypothetical protein